MKNKIKKIISVTGDPASGMKILKVQTDKGLETIPGDWRMIDMIVEDFENENS